MTITWSFGAPNTVASEDYHAAVMCSHYDCHVPCYHDCIKNISCLCSGEPCPGANIISFHSLHYFICYVSLERLVNLLPEDKQEGTRHRFSGKPQFSVEYRLDARNLCADFREDIEFRFSFSPSALLSRYMGREVSITAFWSRQQPQVCYQYC